MSGSIEVPIDQIQPLDMVHWQSRKCPGDNYSQVISILSTPPDDTLIVIWHSIRKPVKRSQVTAAVRNEVIPQQIGPLHQLSKVWDTGRPKSL